MQQPPGYPPGPPGGGYPPGPPMGGYPPGPPMGGYPPGPPMGGPPQQYPYGPPGGTPGGGPPPKKGMSAAGIVLIVLAVLIAMGGGGCALCVCLGVKGAEDAKEKEAVLRRNAPKIRIDDLLSAYKANEVRADSAYKDKFYTIQGGQVDDVKKSIGDSMYVTVGTGKIFEIPQVQCLLKSDQTTRASRLSKGSRVTIRGKVTGLLLNVTVSDCEIM